jgi:hypothetical protein
MSQIADESSVISTAVDPVGHPVGQVRFRLPLHMKG